MGNVQLQSSSFEWLHLIVLVPQSVHVYTVLGPPDVIDFDTQVIY